MKYNLDYGRFVLWLFTTVPLVGVGVWLGEIAIQELSQPLSANESWPLVGKFVPVVGFFLAALWAFLIAFVLAEMFRDKSAERK